jgi:hypothetical protein
MWLARPAGGWGMFAQRHSGLNTQRRVLGRGEAFGLQAFVELQFPFLVHSFLGGRSVVADFEQHELFLKTGIDPDLQEIGQGKKTLSRTRTCSRAYDGSCCVRTKSRQRLGSLPRRMMSWASAAGIRLAHMS